MILQMLPLELGQVLEGGFVKVCRRMLASMMSAVSPALFPCSSTFNIRRSCFALSAMRSSKASLRRLTRLASRPRSDP